MSIDEKARAYDNILEKARKWYNANTNAGYRSIFEDIFPELAESEDERIRKALISVLQSDFESDTTIHDISVGDIIAWLEKQSKQSSNILWHDVSEEPDEQREIFCEWKWNDGVWHDVVFYHADTKNFWDGEQKIEGVVKWTYVNEMLGKQVEQKSITSTSVPFETSDYSELIGKTITIPDGCSAHIKDNNVYINKQDKSGIKPKFRVKYAGSEYNVLEIKEIGGITFYGIYDEPNHIDFIQAANCEII